MSTPSSEKSPRKWARRLFLASAVFLSISLLAIAGLTAAVIRESGLAQSFLPLLQATYLLRTSYVSEISKEELREKILQGVLSQLDPHSSYLPPKARDAMIEQLEGSYGGVGLTARALDGKIIVQEVHPDSPASAAGLKPGETLVKINGSPVDPTDIRAALDRIRGPIGSEVRIGVLRDGKIADMAIPRAGISVPSVQWALIPSGENSRTIYLRVRNFGDRTFFEVRDALVAASQKLLPNSPSGILLDLRGNPGGLLEAAVDISGLFLPPNTVVVSSKGRSEEETLEFPTPAAPPSDPILASVRSLPLAVLVDGASASASEIVAGAIQDLQRGLVVGSRTFGKGSVQSIYPLSNGGAMKVTTSLYYTPKGRSIQATGIIPDMPVSISKPAPWLSEADLPNHLSAPAAPKSERKSSESRAGSAPSGLVSSLEEELPVFSTEIELLKLDEVQSKALEALSSAPRPSGQRAGGKVSAK